MTSRETSDTADLIREIYADVKVVKVKVVALESHAAATNGAVADLREAHLRQEGALSVMVSLMKWGLAGISAGAALAGVVLVMVAR